MIALASSVLPNHSTTSAPKAMTGMVCDTTKIGNTISRSARRRKNMTPMSTPNAPPDANPISVSAKVRRKPSI